MKILLGNYGLSSFGGTESWIRSLALAFKKLNHDVSITSGSYEYFAKEYLGDFPEVDLNNIPDDFDFSIINHVPIFQKIKSKKFFKIYVSHGAFDDIGRCIDGANFYVCVSKEIKDLEEKRGYNCKIIYNPINTERFRVINPINIELKNLLLFSKGASLAESVVRQASNELGIKLILHRNEIFDVEYLINQADCVIAIGRCLIESMACGRNVISGDYRVWMSGFQGAGTITKDNFYDIQKSHYSGRDNPINFTVAKLKDELLKYDYKRGEELRELCLKDHDYITVAKQFLEIYERNK